MSNIVMPEPASRHHLLPENGRARMAKVDLRKTDLGVETVDEWKARIGSTVDRVRTICRLSLKEFAAAINRDERQVARWIAGTERPQFDALFKVDEFREVIVIALAELADGIEITTQLLIRRR